MVSYLGDTFGTAAIIEPYKLFFWPENMPEGEIKYDLSGCENGGLQSNGLDMILTNDSGRTCELRFDTHEQT